MIIAYDQIPQLVETNLQVKVSQELVNGSRLKKTSVASTFIPELSLYAQTEEAKLNKVAQEPSAGVIANVTLFNGFRDFEQNRLQGLNYQTATLEHQKTYNESVLEARKHFLNALKIQENLKILGEYEVINKNNRALILKKVSSGLSPRSEELIFKKIELELREQRIKEENSLKASLSDLRNSLSLDKAEKLELKGNVDYTAYTYTPPVKKLDLALVESAEASLESEKKLSGLWRMPRVNFYAEKSFTNHVNGEFLEEDDDDQVVGLRVTLPLLSEKNSDSIESQVKQTELKAALLRKKQQIRNNETTDEKIEIQLSHLKSMIEISKSKVELSKDIMEKTFSEFRIGLKEADNLNEATAEYVAAKLDLLEHQIEYIQNVEEAKANALN